MLERRVDSGHDSHHLSDTVRLPAVAPEQSGSAMQVSFDAAWVDGHGAAPEAQGPAKISGNTVTFKFEDTFENSGTGTITRAGDDEIIVSLNPTHVVEPRCLAFYGKNIRLKRTAKK